MAAGVLQMSLAVLLVTAMCFILSSAQLGCLPAISSLSPCLSFLNSNSSTPSDACCSQVAAVVKTQGLCLCSFLGSSAATQLGSIVNQAQALSLPGACKVDNPLVNQCSAMSNSQTPVTQSPAGALPPASQETPSDQIPTTASAPASLPALPAGSGKAGESSAAAASAAKFVPVVFFLPLVASSVFFLPVF
ncbi:non-specific lipid-transfer protein 4.1-like [Phalaenopsis equestris]|uniref:non-specific lipid-transfer protein 4.1-like n=1 Tax=Phalaenopsis equestris TaxID=78828 RepID=UPI0009E52623|nr:non-specific lipid-transfer protein 4.1-like [Phalaenopsis equestris]